MVETNLSCLTTLRLGGPAGRLITGDRDGIVIAAIRDADVVQQPILLLAGGSNLVIADEGFAGTVVHIRTSGIELSDEDERVILTVAAGEPWDALVERCVAEDLAGFECLAGIPGSVGATPIQNVGAYGQEVSESILSVRAFDRRHSKICGLPAAECGFAYRTSMFKRTKDRWVVLAVTFALPRQRQSMPIRYAELARTLGIPLGQTAPLADVRAAVLSLRRAKGMVLDPADPDTFSAGSFFLNPVLTPSELEVLLPRMAERWASDVRPPMFPQEDGSTKISAAWLIERAGFQRSYGNPTGIAISSKHTLALTNRGRGTTAELMTLAREIAAGVRRQFGIDLKPEPVLIGPTW